MTATLTTTEVTGIYYIVVADFADSGDPVSPIGIKSHSTLESTVARQHAGFGNYQKYPTPLLSAATLTYGICCNHPFHNGNKRTGLVSMLCHLDKNDLTFHEEIGQEELYELMISVAGHELVDRDGIGDYSDEEIDTIARWLRKWTRRVRHDERIITCRELRTILKRYGMELENLKDNHIDVVRYRRPFFGFGSKLKREKVMRIPYPRDGAQVGRSTLRDLRAECRLTDDDGVDSDVFYTKLRPADYFVNRYRKTLRSLAKT